MKLKRKLKKLFLYDRSFIKMVCFLIVLLLVLILGNTFGFVSADDEGTSGSDRFLNQGDYESSSVYQADNAYVSYITTTSDSIIASNLILNGNTFEFTGSLTPSTFDASNIKNYILFGSNVPSYYRLYMFDDENCFAYYDDSTNSVVIVCNSLATSSGYFYVADIQAWSDGNHLVSPFVVMPDTCTRYNMNNLAEVSRRFVRVTSENNSTRVLATNMPLLTKSTSDTNTMGSHIIAFCNSGSGNIENIDTYSLRQVNYLLNDAYDLGGFDNLVGIGNGGNGGSGEVESNETTENNLYLRASKWTFSIPAWEKLTSYSGNATFSASLNEFQQENLSDFYLRFTFNIHTTQSYVSDASWGSGTSGGGHDTSDVLGSGSNSTGYNNYIFKYVDSSTNNDYQEVSLQDFYNMGSSKAFMTLNGIFDRCYKVGFSGNVSDTKFSSWYSDAISSSRYTTTKAILYCYATLYDSSGNSSGQCVYYYDLLNGTSGVTDSSMSVNNNPYVDEDGNASGEVTTESSTTDNNYSGNGVNVTQTVTVNNDSGDSKSWLWTLITSLITTDNETVSEAGMSDTLVNFVGINPWISLMSTTFGFIPATIWTTLSACFIVVMGILVVAFVLRIILDLL